MNSIQNKLALIFIIGLLITTSLTGFIIIKYESFVASITHLSDKTNEIESSAYNAQIYFKTQIQEWKNTLLRGYDNKLYNKYHSSFLLYEKKTMQEVEQLSVLAEEYPTLKNSAVEFIKEHKKLSVFYREGLSIYNKMKYDPQIAADKHVRGIDREPIKLLSRIIKLSTNIYENEEKNKKENLNRIKSNVALIYISTFILLAVFFWYAIRKGISQPVNEEIRRNYLLAMTDGLTGIANRHAYNERISHEIEHNSRHKDSLTLLIFDIDKFKSINDNFGHEAGDEVIGGVAKILKSLIRKDDFVARYGGEEFVVLLLNTDINVAESVANKLRESIEHNEYYFNKEKVVITVSAGLAELKINETKKELFERTDAALYKAKKTGRNKCVKAAS